MVKDFNLTHPIEIQPHAFDNLYSKTVLPFDHKEDEAIQHELDNLDSHIAENI